VKDDANGHAASEEAIKHFEQRLQFFIINFDKKRHFSRVEAFGIQRASITLGAAVTILIGARPLLKGHDGVYDELLSIVTLLLSAVLTALGAWESFAGHKWRWVRYRTSLHTLYAIKEDFEFDKSKGELTAERVDGYYMQLRNAVHETNQEWAARRAGLDSGGGRSDKVGPLG
jgi:hypothetical protein